MTLKYIYQIQKEVSVLSGVMALLGWDEKTYMPKLGIENRASQMSFIQDLMYERLTNPKLYSALNTIIKNHSKEKVTEKEILVVKAFFKDVNKIRKIPKSFMQELIRESVIAGSIWETAREKNNFKIFSPHLEKLVQLKRKEAKLLEPNKSCYNTLLDEHEEGMTSEKLTKIFTYLKMELIDLLKRIKISKTYKKQKRVSFKIKNNELEKITLKLISNMGLKSEQFSLNESVHPFTTKIGYNDVRITTRYNDPLETITATVHEAGHALYELGMPKEYAQTVIGSAASVGLHESQSRFWENMIVRNEHFWKGFYKKIKKYTKANEEKFYRSVNMVKPSFIRVEADEVTYSLHIILRFEIERDLLNDKLKVKNAKKEWNKKFHEMFGIKVRDDNHGILQDVHWSMGAFGYFPTYAIGTIYAAQIYAKLQQTIPRFNEKLKHQDFDKITKWLRTNIHSKGKTLLADQIIMNSTGSGLEPKTYIKYLNEKYSKLYELRK